MSSDSAPRHQSRERALTLLYEADLKGDIIMANDKLKKIAQEKGRN